MNQDKIDMVRVEEIQCDYCRTPLYKKEKGQVIIDKGRVGGADNTMFCNAEEEQNYKEAWHFLDKKTHKRSYPFQDNLQ